MNDPVEVQNRLIEIRLRTAALGPGGYEAVLVDVLGRCRASAAWESEAIGKLLEVMENVVSEKENQQAS